MTPTKIKKEPAFVMRLAGPKDAMLKLVGPLMDLRADVFVKTTKTTATIKALVPQENAQAAMNVAGLP